MAAGNAPLSVTLSFVDKATSPLSSFTTSLKKSVLPLQGLKNKLKLKASDLGLTRISDSFGKVGSAAGGVIKQIRSLGKEFAIVTGAASAAFSLVAWRTSSVGDAVAKTAQKVGVSAETWSALSYAGDQSGVAASTLQTGLTRLNKSISEAASGGKNASAMFAGFGISIYDANGSLKTADVVMGEVADKLNLVRDSARRSHLAALAFGRSAGPEMIPMLNAGSEGIEGLMKRAAELGLVWSGIDSSNAEVFGDTMADVRNAVDGVVFSIGKQLLPILTDWGNEAISLITKHRELISVKVGEWLQRFNEYLPTLKEDLKGVWKSVSNFALKVDSLVQSLGGWEKVIPYIVAGIAAIKLAPLILSVGLLAKAFFGLGVAVLANPITVAIAALAGTAYLIYDNWEPISAWWGEVWTSWKWAVGEAWEWITKQITECVKNGIAKITAFGEAIGGFLSTLWAGITSTVSTAWSAIVGTIKSIFTPIVAYFTERIDAVKSAFDVGLVDGIKAIILDFSPALWIADALNALVKKVTGVDLIEEGKKIINSLLDGLKSAWEGVKQWFADLGKNISGLIPDSVTDVLKVAQSIGGGISDGISSAVDTGWSALSSVADSIGGALGLGETEASYGPPAGVHEMIRKDAVSRSETVRDARVTVDFSNLPQGATVKTKGVAETRANYRTDSSAYAGLRMGM